MPSKLRRYYLYNKQQFPFQSFLNKMGNSLSDKGVYIASVWAYVAETPSLDQQSNTEELVKISLK